MSHRFPSSFQRIVGPLPAGSELPNDESYPFTTIRPVRDGYVERDGVRCWYAVWGEEGEWIAFAPPFQMVHTQFLKATVPYLAHHFRVITQDGRGNGRSDRPGTQDAYTFDNYYADFVATLDAVGAERVAVIGISASAMTVLRLAAEQPERVSHVIVAGGFAESLMQTEEDGERIRNDRHFMHNEWPTFIHGFVKSLFSEPYSTKPFEDTARYAWSTNGRVIDMCRNGWLEHDVRDLAKRIACPTLVIHGDSDARVPYADGKNVHAVVPDSQMLTVVGGGHITAVRDPVLWNHTVRDFVRTAPRSKMWTHAIARPRKALFISSPIGLGHVQRDLAIARELRQLQPDLAIDWFTVHPASTYLECEGERVHPITARLANESHHFEQLAGEHDLNAFFALRTMDEIMINNFMTFSDLVESEHYDIVVADEAWDVDYYYHENPELKRHPFVFLTDFVGCLPMNDDEREAHLCTDRNAEDIAHVARYPYVRDASIFIGNAEDVTTRSFGPGLPSIREWTDRNFSYSGYTLPFDPAAYADTDRIRRALGYAPNERVVIATVGGTGVGRHLLDKLSQAFVHMKKQEAALRMVLVAGPRLDPASFPMMDGLDVRPYVHNLFAHLACCSLALVQGGLSTCMELVATRRPFLSFPLRGHFEQNVHVRQRLTNYGADRAVDYASMTPRLLADAALAAMHEPVKYRDVESGGAARAARRIADVLENRRWVSR